MKKLLGLIFVLYAFSQNKNIIKLYYNEKDCYQCNQLLYILNHIDTSHTEFHLYIKNDLKDFINELIPLNQNVMNSLILKPVNNNFFTKINFQKNCSIPSMVVFSNQDTYDSFPLKDLGKYKNIRKFISFPNPSNQQQTRTESINEKINSSIHIRFSDSIKIAEITNYFYHNGHLGISDGLLNKFHLFNFNNPDDKISYKWYNFNFFPDYQFTKCNCFDTLMHKSSRLKSGNFYHPMFKKQIFHSFLNDTGFFLMLKYPYFSTEIKNDTNYLTIESKAYIYGRGYHAKKGNFICIKEDGVINKIKETFVQDFYFPFHIDNKDIYTKVYNEQNFYDNRFMAKYIILDSCISSFHSLLNFEYKPIDKLNKQASIMRNNSGFYYFINDFIFWDYKNFKLYHIPFKKMKCNKKSKPFIQDCMMKKQFLYVIYTDNEKKYFLIYDVKENKIIKNESIKNQFFQNPDNILIFCPEKNKVIILNKHAVEFSDIQIIFE